MIKLVCWSKMGIKVCFLLLIRRFIIFFCLFSMKDAWLTLTQVMGLFLFTFCDAYLYVSWFSFLSWPFIKNFHHLFRPLIVHAIKILHHFYVFCVFLYAFTYFFCVSFIFCVFFTSFFLIWGLLFGHCHHFDKITHLY